MSRRIKSKRKNDLQNTNKSLNSTPNIIPHEYSKKKILDSKIKPNNGRSKLIPVFIISVILIGSMMMMGIFSPDGPPTYQYTSEEQDSIDRIVAAKLDISITASPDCGCCHLYVEYLEDLGFSINFIRIKEYTQIKYDLNIPEDSWSCHTMVIDSNYFVEGHIPIEVVVKLLDTSPDIDGISLPGMPAGSPGMGGNKAGSWNILNILDGLVAGTFMEY